MVKSSPSLTIVHSMACVRQNWTSAGKARRDLLCPDECFERCRVGGPDGFQFAAETLLRGDFSGAIGPHQRRAPLTAERAKERIAHIRARNRPIKIDKQPERHWLCRRHCGGGDLRPLVETDGHQLGYALFFHRHAV